MRSIASRENDSWLGGPSNVSGLRNPVATASIHARVSLGRARAISIDPSGAPTVAASQARLISAETPTA
jgi:hypothetical protein